MFSVDHIQNAVKMSKVKELITNMKKVLGIIWDMESGNLQPQVNIQIYQYIKLNLTDFKD